MGLVLETYPGEDGLVRKAKIKTATSVYDRPIHKLYLIATKEELNSMPQLYNLVKANVCSAKKQVVIIMMSLASVQIFFSRDFERILQF